MLLPLQWVPTWTIGDYEVKRVALLGDVLDTDSSLATSTAGSIPELTKVKPAFKDSCPKGMVCIDDYSNPEAPHGMIPFYEALEQLQTLDRPVRIAYLGDSFIEVDILTSSLRALLQKHYGGRGVGFLDADPPYAANRATVRQRSGGWTDHCVLKKGSYDRNRLFLSQHYFTPNGTAWTEITGVNQPGLDSTDVHTLYLRSSSPVTTGLKLDGSPMYALRAAGNGRLEALSHTTRSSRTRWQVSGGAGTTVWGMAEESRRGIVVDNFSLRGSGGTTLTEIPVENFKEMNAVRPYDLIVLQYGLNVAGKKQKDYSNYAATMKTVIERLKEGFPEAGILIVGVGDREDRLADGRLHTLPGILALMRYQQNLAAETGVAFWNLYNAMGGEGSIKRMAEAKPAEAGKDYTHINQRGGDRIAKILYNSIIYGHQQYKRRKAYEADDGAD